MKESDIGTIVPKILRNRIQVGKSFHFGQTKDDTKGKALGKQELAYRFGWWQEGMTEKGKTTVVAATLKALRKFQCGDRVACKEPREDSPHASNFHLYKVFEVPLEHHDVSSDDRIKYQWFERINSFGVNAVYIRHCHARDFILTKSRDLQQHWLSGAPPGVTNPRPVFEPRAPNQGASCALGWCDCQGSALGGVPSACFGFFFLWLWLV